MRTALQWIRSILFNIVMYVSMIAIALAFTPLVLVDRKWAPVWMRIFARWTRFTLRWIAGLRTEVRGEIPTTGALIASKHQSFLDSILLFSVLPAPRFIMKKQLAWIPLMGWMALQAGFIPVDRGKRGAAIKKMMADVEKGRATPGQLIIYPQGTRVAPGAHLPTRWAPPPSTASSISLLSGGGQCGRLLAAARDLSPARHRRGGVPAADPARPNGRGLHGRAGDRDRGRLEPADRRGPAGLSGPALSRPPDAPW